MAEKTPKLKMPKNGSLVSTHSKNGTPVTYYKKQRLSNDELYDRFNNITNYEDLLDRHEACIEEQRHAEYTRMPFDNNPFDYELEDLEDEINQTDAPSRDFSNVDFSGIDFAQPIINSNGDSIMIDFNSGANRNPKWDFAYADFSKANLSNASFNNTNMYRTNFSNANLSDTHFRLQGDRPQDRHAEMRHEGRIRRNEGRYQGTWKCGSFDTLALLKVAFEQSPEFEQLLNFYYMRFARDKFGAEFRLSSHNKEFQSAANQAFERFEKIYNKEAPKNGSTGKKDTKTSGGNWTIFVSVKNLGIL